MPGNGSDRVGLRLRSGSDAPNLLWRDPGHPDCILSSLGRYCNRVFSMTCQGFLSQKKTVSYFLDDLFKLFPALSFSLSDNLFSLNSFPWDVDPVPDYAHASVAHLRIPGNDPSLDKRVFLSIVFKTTRTIPEKSLIQSVNPASSLGRAQETSAGPG